MNARFYLLINVSIPLYPITYWLFLERTRFGVVVNELDCNMVISEFKTKSGDHFYFQINIIRKIINLLIAMV